MDNVFKKMNESIFKGVKMTWFDVDGIMELDETRYVRIVLDDVGTHNSYNGHWVEVFNRQNGLISKKFFKFRYHMEFIHRQGGGEHYYIWFNNDKLDWYISTPKNVKDYVKILMDYIEKIK